LFTLITSTSVNSISVLIGTDPPNGTIQLPSIDYTVGETQQVVTLTEDLSAGEYVTIRRHTDADTRIIEFSQGAQVTAKSLNKALDQLFFIVQENFTFQQVLIEFPTSLINVSGIQGGDALIWDSNQSLLVPGTPTMEIGDLSDVHLLSPGDTDVLTFSENAGGWISTGYESIDPTGDINFGGDCDFTGTISVPSSSNQDNAVNKGEVDAIVSTHSANYNTAMLARIEKLEADAKLIIARGRFWNKTSDYWCRPNASSTEGGNQGYTLPTFDHYKQLNDWDNLKNLVLSNSYYIPMSGVSCSPDISTTATGATKSKGTAFFSQTQMDTFTFDFSFEDSTVVPESVNALKPPQYHIQLTVEGVDDRVYQVGDNSRFYFRYGIVHKEYWAADNHLTQHETTNRSGGGASGSGSWEYLRDPGGEIGWYDEVYPLPARAGWMDNFPWGMNAASYLPPNYNNHRYSNGRTYLWEGSSWGMGHDMMQRHGGWNSQDQFGDPDEEAGWTLDEEQDLMEWDEYRSCRGITQPLAGIKICNKSQFGFSVVYWIRRPLHFEFVRNEAGEHVWHAVLPYQKVDALNLGTPPVWVSFPFPYNFNFNIIVTE